VTPENKIVQEIEEMPVRYWAPPMSPTMRRMLEGVFEGMGIEIGYDLSAGAIPRYERDTSRAGA
jgi:hypothetical protein